MNKRKVFGKKKQTQRFWYFVHFLFNSIQPLNSFFDILIQDTKYFKLIVQL